MLTNEAIKKGIILDYSLDVNKVKVLNMPTIQSIDTLSCSNGGTFKILAKMGRDIPLTFNWSIHKR